ncbi:hypothetical protein WJX72_002782 [[Myrmecia] bisecta]|uniref:Synergin gamma C-terminal domain-containing protein n=1 Tax=[Myrmecia] bisecta TaxID=41462 RepID=A0AAW1PL83_9CHLO
MAADDFGDFATAAGPDDGFGSFSGAVPYLASSASRDSAQPVPFSASSAHCNSPAAKAYTSSGPIPLEFFESSPDDAENVSPDGRSVATKPQSPSWAAVPDYKRGDLVWYRQRDGSLTAAKVVAVDLTVRPPSYGVEFKDTIRETEADRLMPRSQSGAAPTHASGASSPKRSAITAASALGTRNSYHYAEAWAELMSVCAKELREGGAFWSGQQVADWKTGLSSDLRQLHYLAGLAHVYLAAALLSTTAALRRACLSAQHPSQLEALSQGWEQCEGAWQAAQSDTDKEVSVPLATAARWALSQLHEPDPLRFDTVLGSMQALLADSGSGNSSGSGALESLAWQEELCGFCLLPLRQLASIPAVPWAGQRQCLVVLANLWVHRMSSMPLLRAA